MNQKRIQKAEELTNKKRALFAQKQKAFDEKCQQLEESTNAYANQILRRLQAEGIKLYKDDVDLNELALKVNDVEKETEHFIEQLEDSLGLTGEVEYA